MKERLPIWFQALVIMLLSGVFMATVSWVWLQDRSHPLDPTGAIRNATHSILYLLMPVPILFLGARFLWAFVGVEGKRKWVEILACWLALVLVLPALLALGFGLAQAPVKVREASFASVSFPTSAAGNNLGLTP